MSPGGRGFGGFGGEQAVEEGGEAALIGRREAAGQRGDEGADLGGHPAGQAPAVEGEADADGSAIVTHRTDRGRPLTWIEVGSVAGPTVDLPSAALRAVRLQIVGSGQGSVPTRDIVAELPELAAAITGGTFRIDPRPLPLAEVEAAWKDTGADQRIVIVP